MTTDQQKHAAAKAALKETLRLIDRQAIIGVGTGSTTNFFIDLLADYRDEFKGAVASSEASAQRLQKHGIQVIELNESGDLPVYIDGADEINTHLQMIKGGGGALTREKVVASASKTFIAIVDQSKQVSMLGEFPLPVEVIPMARAYVARQLTRLGGQPALRAGVTTDNGHLILDVHHLKIMKPIELEEQINQIAGVVSNGLFARRSADIVVVGKTDGVDLQRARSY